MNNGQRAALETEAKRILVQKDATLDDLRRVASGLKKERSFAWARKVFGLARTHKDVPKHPGLALKLAQEQALCTYKDPDQPMDARLDRAFAILEEVEDLRVTTNQETLGLAGAICKRRHDLDGHPQNLHRSLAYYHRGYLQGIASDLGYTATNAAFILDVLAFQEESQARDAGSTSAAAAMRRSDADRIRTEMIGTLPKLAQSDASLMETWWYLVTIAEAYFGLGQYELARPWLKKATALENVPEWERESTSRQLAYLASLQPANGGHTACARVLQEFMGGNAAAVRTAFSGKVGLALSGGGFRASLFHIGVLAKLAEADMLRHVEVLSCVSGGSIVGAYYYLEVRHLLQTKPDSAITREDYVDIVKRLAEGFLAGVQRNIRTRVAAEWLTNLKMLFFKNYSRTERAGELYESELYSRVPDGEGQSPRMMGDLLIRPLGETNFSPKFDNWRRQAKVPILVLNATTLNTGHNWQFTATWMGEPPAGIDSEIDSNDRYRRMYYTQAPTAFQSVRLGHAVAASACVPGLFEPIVLDGLYPDRTVRLVDGGVHDNQGIAGLMDQECAVMLVSDASGQMESENDPSSGLIGVPLRSNTIFQARLRETQFHELAARRRSALLRGLMFLHLKKDLNVTPVNWITCDEPLEEAAIKVTQGNTDITQYGIPKDVQRCLAGIRTDLDSFCDVEAFALMTSGYRMTEHELPRTIRNFEMSANVEDWDFLSFEKLLKNPMHSQKTMSILKVAKHQAFKIWELLPALKVSAITIAVLAVIILSAYTWIYRGTSLSVTIGAIASPVLLAAVGRIVGPTVMRLLYFRKTLHNAVLGVLMCSLGFLIVRIHLHIFDRLYQRYGRVG